MESAASITSQAMSSEITPGPQQQLGTSTEPSLGTPVPAPDSTPGSGSTPTMASSTVTPGYPVDTLVLDAGPLLSHLPLTRLARRFVVPPLVLAELRDQGARERWERLKLELNARPTVSPSSHSDSLAQVGGNGGGAEKEEAMQVRDPEASWMAEVVAFAKRTGDYAVLSKADLCVLALTYGLNKEYQKRVQAQTGELRLESSSDIVTSAASATFPSTSDSVEPSTRHSDSTAEPSKTSNPWTRNAASQNNLPEPAEARIDEDDATDKKSDTAGDNETSSDFPPLAPPTAPTWSSGVQSVSSDRAVDTTASVSELTRGVSKLAVASSTSTIDASQTDSTPAHPADASASASPADDSSHEVNPPGWYDGESAHSDNDANDEPPSDDGEGDWITPGNVSSHKARDLGLLPEDDMDEQDANTADGFQTVGGKGKNKKNRKRRQLNEDTAPKGPVGVACMTGDFAVQNVLIQMGLELVGQGGKRIREVKSWMLRCHACFKLCRDPSKKFCPSCGNPSLIRCSVTTRPPVTPGGAPEVQVHLKKNFQYRTRGTKYSIPEPKMGSAKGQNRGGSGLVLREDQREFMDGVKREEIRRQKEERALERALRAEQEGRKSEAGMGGWNDPDWMPEILTVGMSGKGRHAMNPDGFPTVGFGRKNPNEVRKKKK